MSATLSPSPWRWLVVLAILAVAVWVSRGPQASPALDRIDRAAPGVIFPADCSACPSVRAPETPGVPRSGLPLASPPAAGPRSGTSPGAGGAGCQGGCVFCPPPATEPAQPPVPEALTEPKPEPKPESPKPESPKSPKSDKPRKTT